MAAVLSASCSLHLHHLATGVDRDSEEEGPDSTALKQYVSPAAGENMDVLLAKAATTPEVIDMISQNLLKLFYRERVQRQARTNNKKEKL